MSVALNEDIARRLDPPCVVHIFPGGTGGNLREGRAKRWLAAAAHGAECFAVNWVEPQAAYPHQSAARIRLGAILALVAMLMSGLLTGCVTPPSARKDLLAFLEIGQTTREEVLLKLGQPSGSFEQERIFTYRIGQYGEEGYFIISPKVVAPAQAASWQNVRFSLVIVFDEQGRLRKHELVKVD